MNAIEDTPDRFACETDTEIRMLGRYIHAVEVGVERIKEEEAAELKIRRETGGVGLMEIIGPEIDHMIAHGEEIPRILKYTQIIALYSFLETRLGLLCEEVNRRNPELNWSPKDLAGNMSIRSFQIFLSKAVDARISVWPTLNTLRLVRNCVVHGNGWIDRMERECSKLRALISSTDGLDEEEGRIVVSEAFVETVYLATYTLFKEGFHNLGFGRGLTSCEFSSNAAN
jgi:hypothetical protein